MDTVHHTYEPARGGVRVKVEKNSRGVNVEVAVDRPRKDGETFDEAAQDAARLARLAYDAAEQQFPDAKAQEGK
jgi:hypothetical protein